MMSGTSSKLDCDLVQANSESNPFRHSSLDQPYRYCFDYCYQASLGDPLLHHHHQQKKNQSAAAKDLKIIR
jgi:hypothetical protein